MIFCSNLAISGRHLWYKSLRSLYSANLWKCSHMFLASFLSSFDYASTKHLSTFRPSYMISLSWSFWVVSSFSTVSSNIAYIQSILVSYAERHFLKYSIVGLSWILSLKLLKSIFILVVISSFEVSLAISFLRFFISVSIIKNCSPLMNSTSSSFISLTMSFLAN